MLRGDRKADTEKQKKKKGIPRRESTAGAPKETLI